MPGEMGVAQAMAGRGDLAIFGVPSGFSHRLAVRAEGGRAEFHQAHAAVADDGQLGMIAIMRHVGLGQFARLNHRRRRELAGPIGRRVFGTSISRPSTLTLIFSIAAGGGFCFSCGGG
jgi:hypothetical protein